MGKQNSVPLHVRIALLIIWPVHAIVRRLSAGMAKFHSLLSNLEIRLLNQMPFLGLKSAGIVPILTTHHCLFIAERLSIMLRSVGIRSDVITEKPLNGFSTYPHIVICPQLFHELPKTYFAFQMEQSINPRWFTKRYLKILKSAQAVFDYSLRNLSYLEHRGFNWRKVFYIPISAESNPLNSGANPIQEEEYDVVFYGDDSNPRRKRFLTELSQSFRVKVINNQFGEALYRELLKAKVIVNIHYYENALLETTRIAEALSLGAIIVSEDTADRGDYPNLEQTVDFVPIDDIDLMIQRVRFWLNDDHARSERKKYIRHAVSTGPDMMEFYFFRFLLAQEIIDFKSFYNRCARHIDLQPFMCLGLPEVQSRMRQFQNNERSEFRYFAGLRHPKSWIGCALSYKFLLMRAREQGLDQLAICEDDVEFPSDWVSKLEQIMEYLRNKAGDWHIFSGLMAVVSDETRVKKVCDFSGLTFVHIDRMMSTVFNIYSKRVFDTFARWDETNENPNENTIDKYIESQSDLTIVTTRPFLVGHRHDSNSTLWGIKNQQYDPMIAKSGMELSRKIDEFETNKASSSAEQSIYPSTTHGL